MAHAQRTANAITDLVGGGVPLYSAITVGDSTYFVSAALLGAHSIPGDAVKFRVGVRVSFNGTEYLKMTDLYTDMVALGKKMFGVDLSSKNFDCWGRFHVILPLEGKWQSTPLRKLLSRDVRQGITPFLLTDVKFKHAVDAHAHLKDATEPIFAVAAKIAKSKQPRAKRSVAEAFEEEDTSSFTPSKRLLMLLDELRTALGYLTNCEGRPLKKSAEEVVKIYPHTAQLKDLLLMDAHEASSMIKYARSGDCPGTAKKAGEQTVKWD